MNNNCDGETMTIYGIIIEKENIKIPYVTEIFSSFHQYYFADLCGNRIKESKEKLKRQMIFADKFFKFNNGQKLLRITLTRITIKSLIDSINGLGFEHDYILFCEIGEDVSSLMGDYLHSGIYKKYPNLHWDMDK